MMAALTPEKLKVWRKEAGLGICTDPRREFGRDYRIIELLDALEAVERVLAEPDDTQWWPVQPYMDPHDEDEVVEVQVLAADRVRAALRGEA